METVEGSRFRIVRVTYGAAPSRTLSLHGELRRIKLLQKRYFLSLFYNFTVHHNFPSWVKLHVLYKKHKKVSILFVNQIYDFEITMTHCEITE